MEGDIDDVDDEKIIRNPFDRTQIKRNYVAYLGHLPNTIRKPCDLEDLFNSSYRRNIVAVDIVSGRERQRARLKGYRYRKKDGRQVKFQSYAYVYFEDAASLREAIHDLNGKPYESKKLYMGLSRKHHQNPDVYR